MGELQTEFEEDQLWITDDATGARWVFSIVADKSGRRHLSYPHGAVDQQTYGEDALRQAFSAAQATALHAGKIDY